MSFQTNFAQSITNRRRNSNTNNRQHCQINGRLRRTTTFIGDFYEYDVSLFFCIFKNFYYLLHSICMYICMHVFYSEYIARLLKQLSFREAVSRL